MNLTESPLYAASPLPLRRRLALLQEDNEPASNDSSIAIAEEVIVVSD